MTLDETHSPQLESWVPVAQDSHFPIQNLPFGIFCPDEGAPPRVGVAIGDWVLDLSVLAEEDFFTGPELAGTGVFHEASLNAFMAMGRPAWREARRLINQLLSKNEARLRDNTALRQRALVSRESVYMCLPTEIGDYTDFYSSRDHARNVGTMFRGAENALPPNWLHLPIAYHGRASSVILSGEDVHRPCGQSAPTDGGAPPFGPCKLLDYELEMGFFVGPETKLGDSISTEQAEEHIFGMVIVNDWSARDIQKWEYQPLGPFTAKNFATSISPWVVTMEALEPFRCPGPKQSPEPLPYLAVEGEGNFDIKLEVSIQTEKMEGPERICRSNYRYLYWDMRQQLAQHTVTGCPVNPGDLMASGTVSGPDKESRGCLLETTWRGEEPIELPSGETRKFLQDGDTVTMTAYCQGPHFRVGFGDCTAKILPAKKNCETKKLAACGS